jgi:hypothetical protein
MLTSQGDAFSGDIPPNLLPWFVKAAIGIPAKYREAFERTNSEDLSDWRSQVGAALRGLYDIRLGWRHILRRSH